MTNPARTAECPSCGATVPVEPDGYLMHHVTADPLPISPLLDDQPLVAERRVCPPHRIEQTERGYGGPWVDWSRCIVDRARDELGVPVVADWVEEACELTLTEWQRDFVERLYLAAVRYHNRPVLSRIRGEVTVVRDPRPEFLREPYGPPISDESRPDTSQPYFLDELLGRIDELTDTP